MTGGLFCTLEAVSRPLGTLRPEGGQPVAVLVQVHQGEGRANPFMVLLQTSISHLHESEDPLQDAKRMLHSGSDSRLTSVLFPL